MASNVSRSIQLALLAGVLVVSFVGESVAQTDCAGVECKSPVNCIEEVHEPGSCCPTCAQFGCTCEGYQFYDCVNVGFQDGKVPEGESYFVDFGSTECSCPPGGGRISCDFIPCPEIPPNCIDILQPADGCPQCGRIGCVHGEEKYDAGHTFHMSECEYCHCPNTGGDLMCYALPHCANGAPNGTRLTDPERQYDYPFSHEQDEALNSEVIEKNNNNYKRNALQDPSMLDYAVIDDMDDVDEFDEAESLTTTPLPLRLVELTTSDDPHLSTEPESTTQTAETTPTLPTTISEEPYQPTTTMVQPNTKPQQTTTQQRTNTTAQPMTSTAQPKTTPQQKTTIQPMTTSQPKTTTQTKTNTQITTKTTASPKTTAQITTKTTASPKTTAQITTKTTASPKTTAQITTKTTASPKTTPQPTQEQPSSTTTESPAEPSPTPSAGIGTEKPEIPKPDPQINNEEDLAPTANEADFPEEEREGNVLTLKSTATSAVSSPSPSAGPRAASPELLSEGGAPKDVSNHSRSYGSAKDLVDSCCAIGQQWSIDHGECENMPLDASEDCRLAEKQCCISYLKENTCISGMIAAKEEGVCLPSENDHCERSQFKLCCDCCSLGLKFRKEGQSCEANLNLGYPCGHMLQLCCAGEDQLLPPETKIPPKPDKDVDECEMNTHNCHPGERCVNTPGSFLCVPEERCQPGFHLEEGVCQDINECEATPSPCKVGFSCLNTLGSFVCRRKTLNCNRGYRPNENGTVCIDIDECGAGLHNCSAEQSCHNLPGSHRCDCKTGYRLDAFRRQCVDINECWSFPGRLCHHTCENTAGSYRCACFAGFRLAADGKHCEDINECEQNPCNQECTNIYGSYQCYCKEGYKLGADGVSCEDIDECQQSAGSLCVFACVNTPGSYQCACPEHGYTMAANKLTCRDIDECEIGTHNCSSTEECHNLQGGYKCLSYECPDNYRRVSNMKCERIQCFGFQDCQNSPLRITYHRLNFPTGVVVPAQIFRIAPSPAYAGDNIVMEIKRGNEENFFSVRKFNPYTGILYLQRPVRRPKDFLLDVEMRLYRQGSVTTFLSRIYIFITASTP